MECNWHAASDVLRHLGLPDEVEDRITRVCHNRAVLLPELADQVAPWVVVPDKFTDAWTVAVTALRGQPRWATEAAQRHRYLPAASLATLARPTADFAANISAARPSSWSWVECYAAGGPCSGVHIGAAVRAVFEEGKTLDAANTRHDWEAPLLPSDRQVSFSGRCAATGSSDEVVSAPAGAAYLLGERPGAVSASSCVSGR